MNHEKLTALTKLFEETAKAHHQAFISTDGQDPEWPIWYAKYLQTPLSSILNQRFTISRIVYELIRLDESAEGNQKPWPVFYAEELVDRYIID